MNLLADATLPSLDEFFLPPFRLTRYHKEDEIPHLIKTHDILLCRSTLKVTEQLLAGSRIQCVATASSGIDHIDTLYLKKKGINMVDAKGCNAHAVADYVVATLAFLYKNHLIIGNKAGVIGVGEVGTQVVARLQAMGFDVFCYDPFKALQDSRHQYVSFTELISCDLLCVHANLHETSPYPSLNLLAKDALCHLKPHMAIINAARGGIINEAALLATEQPIVYCTDVYQREPEVSAQIIDFSTICTPHIAGHSIEAKQLAIIQICQKLHSHFDIPIPVTATFSKISEEFLWSSKLHNTDWYDEILSMYNPIEDTQILKSASNKKKAFLTRRQAHQHRHDFPYYFRDKAEKNSST
jgi:erythronate-4-phosphate dehydrogenase